MSGSPENPPAFPREERETHYGAEGMSLRDWFAGQALMGICANGDLRIGNDPDKVGKAFAGVAYELADLMLLARDADALLAARGDKS